VAGDSDTAGIAVSTLHEAVGTVCELLSLRLLAGAPERRYRRESLHDGVNSARVRSLIVLYPEAVSTVRPRQFLSPDVLANKWA